MRRRSESHSFFENLDAGTARLEVAFENIERGPQPASLDKRRKIETASHMNEWLTSPKLKPPKAKVQKKPVSRELLGMSGQGPCIAVERVRRLRGTLCSRPRMVL